MGLPKILIVDSTPASLADTKAILSKVVARLIEAQSGAAALDCLVEHDFALILLNVDLPDMDGFQVAETINALESYRNVPIIFVGSALMDQNHQRRGYQVGAADYIQKPIEEDILVSKANIFLKLYQQKRELEVMRDDLETRVDERTAALRRTQKLARVGGWSMNLEQNTYRICDTAFELFFSNSDRQKVTGGSQGSFLDLLPRSERSRVSDIMLEAAENKLSELEFEFRYFNASNRPCTAFSYANLTYKGDRLAEIQGAVQDVTERKASEGKLNHVATHDALTGLPNRYLFRDRLDQAFLRAERAERVVAILLLDLDHFKDINDTLGHPVGDQLLTEAGKRLSLVARASDTVARLGGDEFAIILAELTDAEDIDVVAQRCIEALTRPFEIDGNQVHTGCSVGISIYPEDGETTDEIIKNADLALYQSKGKGRGVYHLYNEEMSKNIKLRKEREARMYLALDHNEFELYYQPKIDLKTLGVVGVEALIRWNHPEEGLVPPNDFIPVAETIGLIHDLGEWVIRSACQTATRWETRFGNQLKMAVNVSATQMRAEDFVQRVAKILLAEQTPGELLEIEITESVVLDDPHATGATLDELRLLGITIALDDFGTGYSSLTHLKHLRASTLKIDRSFINNIMDDQYDQHIAEKMIELAQKLQMQVVAEGIETEDQLNRLTQSGCDIGQGYLFSRPLPEADFLNWLEAYEARIAEGSQHVWQQDK